MSEETTKETNANEVKLNGLFATKIGMTTSYSDDGEAIPVTVLRFEPWTVSQVKSVETDGYSAIQIAGRPKKAKNSNKAEKGRLKGTGIENAARWVREIRQSLPEGVATGQKVSIHSLAKGDLVKVTARSKGRGFAGVMKRWDFGGGPASHGSGFHRQPGSSGNRTWPGRIVPGKKYPGHYGDAQITTRNLEIVNVLPEEGAILVKGAIPGAVNGLVRLLKES